MCLERLHCACLFLLLSASILPAQDNSPSQVLRSSLIEGDVTYWRSDLNQWIDLDVNAPLVEGDKVWVGRDGRAEIEFEDGSMVRLAQNSGIELVHTENSQIPGKIGIHLSGGLATFEVASDDGAFQLTTPLFSARALKVANFRAEVDNDGSGRLVVFRGDLEIESQPGRLTLSKGETLQLLSNDPDRYYLGTNYEPDEWDKWNSERDEYLVSMRNNTHAPLENGWDAAELGQYGSWYAVPGYGTVWRPHCDDNWVPFSSGRWSWYDSFGWTWISSEPWGWLPYHYGRWAHVASHGWCWVPGKRSSWCPGAVSWLQGPGWVAWAPLAPSEPWSRRGNGTHNTSVNLTRGGLISYLPEDRFLNGSSSPRLSNARQLLLDGKLLSGQPSLPSARASRTSMPDTTPRNFTNDDLEARRNVRDRMIRSTVPAGSLTENSRSTGGSMVSEGTGTREATPHSSDSGIRVIQGGSRTSSSSTSADRVRTYSNSNLTQERIHQDQLRSAVEPSRLGPESANSAQTPHRSSSSPLPQGHPPRERVYRIYGSQNESARSGGSPPSTPQQYASPRRAGPITTTPPGQSTSVTPSAPPSRFQPVQPSSSSSSTAASGHPPSGASGTNVQDGRSGSGRGRTGR